MHQIRGALQSWSRKEPFSGTFSPMNALWRRQFDIDENETYCVSSSVYGYVKDLSS